MLACTAYSRSHQVEHVRRAVSSNLAPQGCSKVRTTIVVTAVDTGMMMGPKYSDSVGALAKQPVLL